MAASLLAPYQPDLPFREYVERTVRVFKTGDRIAGYVTDITSDHHIIDIGYKHEGKLKNQEIPVWWKPFKIGAPVETTILNKTGEDGKPELTLQEHIWETLQEHHKTDRDIVGEIVSITKKGAHINIGVPGFVPNRHLPAHWKQTPNAEAGQLITTKIRDLNNRTRQARLSHTAHLLARNPESCHIKKGTTLTVTVTETTATGFRFVTNGITGETQQPGYQPGQHVTVTVTETTEPIQCVIAGTPTEKKRNRVAALTATVLTEIRLREIDS